MYESAYIKAPDKARRTLQKEKVRQRGFGDIADSRPAPYLLRVGADCPIHPIHENKLSGIVVRKFPKDAAKSKIWFGASLAQ